MERGQTMKLPPDLVQKILATPGVVVGPGVATELPRIEAIDEKSFQSEVVRLAKRNRWLCFHPFDSRKSVAGFPDLTLVRDRVIFAELKTDNGELSAPQMTWRDALLAAGAEWYLWRPSMWSEIERILA